jgi:hypothetical protein
MREPSRTALAVLDSIPVEVFMSQAGRFPELAAIHEGKRDRLAGALREFEPSMIVTDELLDACIVAVEAPF